MISHHAEDFTRNTSICAHSLYPAIWGGTIIEVDVCIECDGNRDDISDSEGLLEPKSKHFLLSQNYKRGRG